MVALEDQRLNPIPILLVDDDARNLAALESILDSSEYKLVKSQTADDALMALMHSEFAAIVLDVQMPDLSGIELAKLIKQRKKTQHVPIIFLTAFYQEDEHVVLGYDVGAVDYLTKPVNPAVLRSKVGVFVDLFRKTRALAQINSAMADEIIDRQRAEERFRSVVESAPNAMVVVNKDGFITLVNPRAEALFGYERGELLDKPSDILVAAEYSLIAGGHDLQNRAGFPSQRELVGRRKDGSEVAIEVGLSAIVSEEGQSTLASIVDITERRQAEAALRIANAELAAKNAELQRQAEERALRIRAEAAQAEAEAARERSAFLAEASNALAASFDYEKTLQEVARLVLPRLGDCCVIDVVQDSGVLKPLVAAGDDLRIVERFIEHRLRFPKRLDSESSSTGGLTKPVYHETLDRTALNELAESDEERRSIESLGFSSYMALPLCARGRTLGCLSLFGVRQRKLNGADISVAEELAQRAGLALDNSRLYSEAKDAREAAEAANAAKDRFLAMLSHELRTPLSPVLHSVTLIETEGEGKLNPDIREALRTIRRNVQLEARLIDDLLDLARIRNGKLQLHREPVDAHELLHRTVEICHPEIIARKLRVEYDLAARDARLLADPARIQQIFWNLITNALKFSPGGATLYISTCNSSDNEIRIEFRDEGKGIAPEKLDRIFDAFEQADDARSSGLGLGLAICRALVSLHGGTIEARSAGFGLGASFLIGLPVVETPVSEAPSEPANPTPPMHLPLRLLLVEDHQDTAAVLKKLLVRRGYEVRSAETVAQALEIAEAFEFDVLVSDIGLPDGTGVELMGELTSRHGERTFRGVALSGFGMQEDLERSSAAGFSYHLTKPVDFPQLDRALVTIGEELVRVNAAESPAPALDS